MNGSTGAGVAVAVRSSATAEDLPTASFAGQHESFLNVRGAKDLFEACRRCFASIFTDRAISYRIDNGFDHFKVALSVAVMKMVRSDLAAQRRHLHARYRIRLSRRGLRHRLSTASAKPSSRAQVDPDEFYVHKPTLRAGLSPRAAAPARRQADTHDLRQAAAAAMRR